MAELTCDGFGEIEMSLAKLAKIPEEVTDAALMAAGQILADKQTELGLQYGIKDTGEMLASVTVKKPSKKGDVKRVVVTYKGSRKRGNTVTTNAEIAFFANYGVPHKGIAARPFISDAVAASGDAIEKTLAEALGNYIDSV